MKKKAENKKKIKVHKINIKTTTTITTTLSQFD
jgi:hypothetical protein